MHPSLRGLLPALLLGSVACAEASPRPPPATPSPPPSASAGAPAPSNPDALCAALCSVHPTAASPQAPRVRHLGPGVVRVLLLWKEPNGDSIQAIGAMNDLAGWLRGVEGVELALVTIDDNGARAAQARRELIDADAPVKLLSGEDAWALAASLAPEQLPAMYLIDPQQRPTIRIDGPPSWKASEARALVAGLVAGQSCSLAIEGGKALGRGCP